ncbi:hypothetical protein [Escherichia coli]|uniref:hypothetical protein n=1 Tax=Escherichia coli TaxID=562 RepID=UPI000542F2DF|nr:hypothetical protein [Escherichia coli]AUA39897.1 hypothetical protein CWI33_04275 [Escherichia coli]EES2727515.1 hypothetical protein [Escherichia coli]EEZ5233690.1 hypothetical protein [Escherichia coli]EFB1625132.1 hypothetical protein [Escherichia coli]EFB3175909.1 hypothetical protein [Escherichia coli]
MQDDKFIKRTFFIVFFFSIFCAFNFFPFISAEVQPVIGGGIIAFGLCQILLSLKLSYISSGIIIFLLFLVPSFITGVLVSSSNGIVLFLYLIGPAVFCYFYKYFIFLKRKHLVTILAIFFIVSIIQAISPDAINNVVNPIFEKIVKRGRLGFYGGGRGVSVLYSEPAHAAKYIFLLSVLLIAMRISPQIFLDKKMQCKKSFLVFMIVVCIILNKSASLYVTYLMLACFFVFFYFIKVSVNRWLSFVFFIPVLALILYVCILFEVYKFLPERLLDIINSYFKVRGSFTLNDLQYFGSIRLISVIAGYAGAFIEPLGAGIGNGGNEIFQIMDKIGFNTNAISFLTSQDVEYLKPNAYGAQISLDAGILGLVIVIIFTVCVFLKIDTTTKTQCFFSSLLALSIFQILFFSTTTITAPWMTLALSLFALKRLKNECDYT